MHNPPHPGLSLRDSVLPALGLSVTQAAMQLGVSCAALSRVINGRAAVSPDMALRIEAWLALQSAYDLRQAKLGLKGLAARESCAHLHRF